MLILKNFQSPLLCRPLETELLEILNEAFTYGL